MPTVCYEGSGYAQCPSLPLDSNTGPASVVSGVAHHLLSFTVDLLNCIISASRLGIRFISFDRTLRDRIAWVIHWTDGPRAPACRSPYGATSGSSAGLYCLGY